MHRGWIKIHRKVADNIFWNDKPFSKGQAWIDLLLLSNHKKNFITVKNGKTIVIESGQCGYSQLALSGRWGWSRGKVNRYLCALNEHEMIQQNIVQNHTVTTILNYNQYQGSTINSTINSTTNGQQTDTNKNDKNDKNDKNAKFPPTIKDVSKYCAERSNNIEPKKFIDHYSVSGWYRGKTKIKDWKACVRTWEQNNNNKPTKYKSTLLEVE